VKAWGDTAPSSLWSKDQTTDWVRTHVSFNNTALGSALAKVWATGTVLGSDAAEHAFSVAGGVDESVRIIANFNWDRWSPGNRPAALLSNPKGGLAQRLDDRSIFLKGLDDTTTNRIGTILTNGLADGLTPHVVATDVAGELIDSRTNWAATLEERLTQIQDDTRRAETIARTEMNQAVADEAMNRYEELGVTQVEWNVIDPCDICEVNDGEVRDFGDDFPSGDSQPTVHPNCNCFLTPVIDFGDAGDALDSLELALKPNLKTFVPPTIGIPGSLEVEKALSRLTILPNPNNPQIGKPEKYVEPPWAIEPVPTIDPNIWDQARIRVIKLNELFSTDPFLKRKNVAKHIEGMGQSLLPYRSYAMVLEHKNKALIIDGHHRLMSLWLLGLNEAPVWYVKE
jgi:hypothetical protein